MKHWIPYLLAVIAVLTGLLLPATVSKIQDSRTEQLEAGGIQQVNLSVESGLSVIEKIGLLADDTVSTLNVGIGQHQTVPSLSKASWAVIEQISSYGIHLLDPQTAQQLEQYAVLISKDDDAFIYWEVIFTDDNGSRLKLCLDDETGKPLAMAYETGTEVAAALAAANDDWYAAAVWTLCDLNGVALSETEEVDIVYNEKDGQPEHLRFTASIGSGNAWAYIDIEAGRNWFSLNKTNIS